MPRFGSGQERVLRLAEAPGVIDLFDRSGQLLIDSSSSGQLADHMRTELVTAALQMALISRQPAPGLVCHSDRGSQYTGAAYRDMLEQHDLRHSVGQPGTCWDNAVAESFFATLKKELIYLHVWPTRQSARTAIFAFIAGWYNRVRLHSTLNYASPHRYEEDYYRLSAAA